MSLGRQRVTVYRMTPQGLVRRVLTNCYYSHTEKIMSYERYERHHRACLLIAPGRVDLQVGDRVYPGVGPETVDWDGFLPVTVPGLSQITRVKTVAVDGKVHHTEAGG